MEAAAMKTIWCVIDEQYAGIQGRPGRRPDWLRPIAHFTGANDEHVSAVETGKRKRPRRMSPSGRSSEKKWKEEFVKVLRLHHGRDISGEGLTEEKGRSVGEGARGGGCTGGLHQPLKALADVELSLPWPALTDVEPGLALPASTDVEPSQPLIVERRVLSLALVAKAPPLRGPPPSPPRVSRRDLAIAPGAKIKMGAMAPLRPVPKALFRLGRLPCGG